MKLLVAADGFGDSRACPDWYPDYIKWPRILGLMTKQVEITDLCRYGAGNEYIAWCVRQHYSQADMILVQWAIPNRLDLVLSHEINARDVWLEQIKQDPIYRDNIMKVGQDQWWISSASTSARVQEYHRQIISYRQHTIRSMMWIEYVHRLLREKPHGFMLTPDSEYLRTVDVDPDTWIWHKAWHGLDSYRHHSKFRDLDLKLAQPIPLIHFDFIRTFMMDKYDLPWRNARELDAVESMLLRKYNECKDKRPR